jgi:FkbM family methyltransferase
VSTSSLDRLAKGAIKKLLERRGYWVRHRSVLPFGLDYMNDIRRLSGIYGWSVDVFFDVGANVGQTSQEALHTFPAASVYAFEPHPTTFAKLIEDTRDPRFHPHNLALSDKSGTASFFDYGALASSNSLVANAQYAAQASHPSIVRSVECKTLHAFCAKTGSITSMSSRSTQRVTRWRCWPAHRRCSSHAR